MTERSGEGEQRGEDTEKEERLPKELGNEDLSVTSPSSHAAQFSETRQISAGSGKVYVVLPTACWYMCIYKQHRGFFKHFCERWFSSVQKGLRGHRGICVNAVTRSQSGGLAVKVRSGLGCRGKEGALLPATPAASQQTDTSSDGS